MTETVFARPGMGKLIYDAVMGNDYNLALLALLLVGRRDACWRRSRPISRSARSTRGCARDGRAGSALGLTLPWLGALLALIAGAALAAPLVAGWLGHDPFTPDLFKRFGPASAEHPLGTDELGRDMLLRLLYGARVSLAVGLVAALAATIIGTAVGLLAAWRGGVVDAALMRLADGMLALPALPLLVRAGRGRPRRASACRAGEAAGDIAAHRRHPRGVRLGRRRAPRARRGALDPSRATMSRAARGARRHRGARPVAPRRCPTCRARHGRDRAGGGRARSWRKARCRFLGLGIQPPAPSWGNMLANAQELVFARPWPRSGQA